MFQLEILDAKILDMSVLEGVGMYEKGAGDAVAVYMARCRTVVKGAPLNAPVVWVYGAGRPSVKASLGHVFIDYDLKHASYESLVRLRQAYARQEGHYLLEVPRGAEIAAGMLISDVPPDAAQGQVGG